MTTGPTVGCLSDFVQTGHFTLVGWGAMTLVGQILWAAPFAIVLGGAPVGGGIFSRRRFGHRDRLRLLAGTRHCRAGLGSGLHACWSWLRPASW